MNIEIFSKAVNAPKAFILWLGEESQIIYDWNMWADGTLLKLDMKA